LPQEAQRVTLYRRLIKIKDPNEVVELKKETEDRFGNLPNSLKFLFDLAFVRCFAKEYGITKILCSREETIIYGEPEGKWEKLRYTGKWSKRLNGVISIGGYVGITSLCEIIKSDEI
jgi:transcription-repair coupling factor (superfamily II helicase)